MKGTVFSVALNHRSQLDAWDQAFRAAPYQTPPKTPVWFIKPRNTHLANGGSIPLPAGETVQSGATLAVVIGRTARKVAADKMADYVAGYALANDVSLPETSFYRPAIKAKCRDGFCPLGEVVSLASTSGLEIITEINGVEQDRWSTADLVRSVPELIAAISDFITLQPGDAVLIGTPHQRVEIKPGDQVTVRAAGLPTLTNPVTQAGE
ncbi:fumarylacetoacetate hydrolase family protein [Serratia fonticola]|uniref:fumarylacetoacetate hydrolase family protein n=1 Tax=Serratia fonticola TaxID=47917 RepID=UPI0015C589FF|nr:fumarylacetoacetate hydrolase family protein [Serratia fonticola]MBC3378962.1 fumarylacetoacetate hydrolase family protein [Serratia fonticola]NYA38162.1 fumarylacetoacetate hydrolase family protein [Serratia fonticola]